MRFLIHKIDDTKDRRSEYSFGMTVLVLPSGMEAAKLGLILTKQLLDWEEGH